MNRLSELKRIAPVDSKMEGLDNKIPSCLSTKLKATAAEALAVLSTHRSQSNDVDVDVEAPVGSDVGNAACNSGNAATTARSETINNNNNNNNNNIPNTKDVLLHSPVAFMTNSSVSINNSNNNNSSNWRSLAGTTARNSLSDGWTALMTRDDISPDAPSHCSDGQPLRGLGLGLGILFEEIPTLYSEDSDRNILSVAEEEGFL